MGKTIVVDGRQINLIDAPISGDVAVTHDGVSTIGSGKVVVDMMDSTLLGYLLPIAVVGAAQVGYSKVG